MGCKAWPLLAENRNCTVSNPEVWIVEISPKVSSMFKVAFGILRWTGLFVPHSRFRAPQIAVFGVKFQPKPRLSAFGHHKPRLWLQADHLVVKPSAIFLPDYAARQATPPLFQGGVF